MGRGEAERKRGKEQEKKGEEEAEVGNEVRSRRRKGGRWRRSSRSSMNRKMWKRGRKRTRMRSRR